MHHQINQVFVQVLGREKQKTIFATATAAGGLAHLARALAWHARGDQFESGILHIKRLRKGPLFFMRYTVYILYSEIKDRYYVGQTENLEKRLTEHNLRKNLGANDWKLVYMEEYDTRSMAMFRESFSRSIR